MDSISYRDTPLQVEYFTSGDPITEKHFHILQKAEQELGCPVTLSLVLNVLKEDRLFSVSESFELAKKLADHLNITLPIILCLDTKEKVSQHLRTADIVIRRQENDLNSSSPYIQNMAQNYNVLDFPEKIKWISNEHPEESTSGRLKALVFVSFRHPQENIRKICHEKALQLTPAFMITAIEKKMRENPDKTFFLSTSPDLPEYLEDIKKVANATL